MVRSIEELFEVTWDYDIETPPNQFLAAFEHATTYELKVFEISERRNDAVELVKFLKSGIVLAGYNNRSFDNTILNRLIYLVEQGEEVSPLKFYNFAQMIIKERDTYVDLMKSDRTEFAFRIETKHRKSIKEFRYWERQPYDYIDLIEQTVINANKPSLKHCAIHLQHERIQDLPYPHNHWLTLEEMDKMTSYCHNDVRITKKLRIARKTQLQLRIDIAESFGLDLWETLNASDSKLANVILETLWGGKPKEQATPRAYLRMDELIGSWVKFETPELQSLEQTMRRVVLKSANKYKWSTDFIYAGVKFAVGVGGLHSVDKPRVLKSGLEQHTEDGKILFDPVSVSNLIDDKFPDTKRLYVRVAKKIKKYLFELDFGSFYPGIILSLGLFPAHLGEKFLTIYRKIVEDRLLAKSLGDAVRAAALKITANGSFGKMLSQFFWLFDPKAPLTVTVTGQLTLFMLIEKMIKIGVKVLSANTDGILVEAEEGQLAELDKVAQGFAKEIDIPLEYSVYDIFAQRDVNNYVGRMTECIIKDGKFVAKKAPKAKVKGALSNNEFGKYDEINFNKGFYAPVIPTAVRDYFLEGKDPTVTIDENKDNPYAFMLTQKVGSEFTQHLVSARGELALQKTNRFVVANRRTSLSTYPVGSFIKRTWDKKKKRPKDQAIIAKKLVAICNDVTDNPPPIDLDWYKDAAWDLIDNINGAGQMSLFGQLKDNGVRTEIFDYVNFDDVDEYLCIED